MHVVSPHLDAIKTAVASRGDQLTPREHAYIRAVLAFASGSLLKAAGEWCTMLIDYPYGMYVVPARPNVSLTEYFSKRDFQYRMFYANIF